MGVPLILLMCDTVIDLNNMRIFSIWLVIALIMFAIFLLTDKNEKFKIVRSSNFDYTSTINSHITEYSTSSLKALLPFLVVYWILNKILKAIIGDYIINTNRQKAWYHEGAQREITGLDVVINIILYVTIITATLFE
jgi:hypothetical protein